MGLSNEISGIPCRAESKSQAELNNVLDGAKGWNDGVHSPAVPGISRRLNRMPMGALKYVFPIEALRALYQTAER